MRIAVIGGHDRTETTLTELAERAGHQLDFHSGRVGGSGADRIRAIVERADRVVILTDINSHGGVQVARRACRKAGVEPVLVKRFGLRQLEALLVGEPLGLPLAS